jgi:hypothetical protein
MASDSFTVRGLSAEARNAVKICSRKAKKTQGEWLNGVILKAAKESVAKKTEIARPEDVSDIIKEMSDRLKAVESQSDKVEEMYDLLKRPWWKKILN